MTKKMDVESRIAAGDKDDLVSLLEDESIVATLTPDQQLALAKHRSVDVPRALAKHGATLTEETQRVLAKSRIFTARRELVKSAGASLPSDLLDALAADEDGAVRNLVAKVREPEGAPPKAKKQTRSGGAKPRKHAGEGFANQSRADLLKLLENETVVAELTPLQQTQIAQHRSVEVPRALARHAAVLSPEAQLALAESRIFTARRELVRRGGGDLPVEVLGLLCEDDDSVVRALVASVWNPSDDELPESVRVRRAEIAERLERIRTASEIDDGEIDDLIRRRDERMLVEVASNRAVVESLDQDRQVALAKHRSIAVPRALAAQVDILSEAAIRELALSPVFTARRALARHGAGYLDQDVLDLLTNDEDAVVRKLVADIAEREPIATEIAGLDTVALEELAAKGDVAAINQLGLNAWAVEDLEAARSWFEKAAGLGDVMAMLDLETLAIEADDALSAQHWLKLAAEAGHASARLRYRAEPVEDPVYDGMDLSGLSFANQDLSRASFVGANLEGVDFTGAILTRAVFCGANATGADFSDAILNAASFGPTVRDVFGRYVDTVADSHDDDDSDGDDDDSEELLDSPPAAAILRGAVFRGANASRAYFDGADLTDADFSGASVRDADFMGADLTGVVADDVDAEGSFYFHINWDIALSDGNFTNRALHGRDFTEMTLKKPVFRFARLDGANFSGMDLTGADFTNASLRGVNFSGAVLRKVDFSGATLVDADLSDSDLDGADLRSAVLTVSELKEINGSADEATARMMLGAIESLATPGEMTEWVVLDNGERISPEEIESHLAEMDRYAGMSDANLEGANASDARMPDWWRHDNPSGSLKRATKRKRKTSGDA